MSVTENKSTTVEKQPRVSAAARSRRATRARLVESGRLLFAKNGLHGVTTHDIAHQAEVASGTFYLHFKNKVEVFQEIADSCVSELSNARPDATAGRGCNGASVGQVRRLGRARRGARTSGASLLDGLRAREGRA